MAAVTIHSDFRAQEKKKSVTAFTFSPSVWHEVMGLNAMISFTLIKRLFSSSLLSDISVVSSAY